MSVSNQDLSYHDANMVRYLIENLHNISNPSLIFPLAVTSFLLLRDVNYSLKATRECLGHLPESLRSSEKFSKTIELLPELIKNYYSIYVKQWNKVTKLMDKFNAIAIKEGDEILNVIQLSIKRSSAENFVRKLCDDIAATLIELSKQRKLPYRYIPVTTSLRVFEKLPSTESLILKFATFFSLIPLLRQYLPVLAKFIIIKIKHSSDIIEFEEPGLSLALKLHRKIDDSLISMVILSHVLARNNLDITYKKLYDIDQSLRALASIVGLLSERRTALSLTPQAVMLATDMAALKQEYIMLSYVYRISNIISPFDIIYFILYSNSNIIDDIYKVIKDYLNSLFKMLGYKMLEEEELRERFIKALAGLHYMFKDELKTSFSEAFGSGWKLPGIVRAYAISFSEEKFYKTISLGRRSVENAISLIGLTLDKF